MTINADRNYEKIYYINLFDKLNKLKLDYPLIKISFDELNRENFFKEYKIDQNKIKLLYLDYNCSPFRVKYDEIKNILNYLFESKYLVQNLIYIELELYYKKESPTDPQLFKNINNFKSLKTLKLNYFYFTDPFIIDLDNLEILSINNSSNITFSENCCNNIKKISLSRWKLENIDSLLNFPNLESFIFDYFNKKSEHNKEYIDYHKIIDFSNLKKLKYFKGDILHFIYLPKNAPLQKLNLYIAKYIKLDTIKNGYKLLFNINTLNNVKLYMDKYDNNILEDIHIDNKSLNNLELYIMELSGKCLLNSLIKKFKNLSKIFIHNFSYGEAEKTIIKIEEDINCKINNFTLILKNVDDLISFSCTKFENLVAIDLSFNTIISNLKHTLPIFKEKCDIMFKSLIKFHFNYFEEKEIKFEFSILKNIFNNLDCMPKLEDFSFDCPIDEVDEKFYNAFISKILSLNLKCVKIGVKNKIKAFYSESELKEIDPNINYNRYDSIVIQKLIDLKPCTIN